MTPAKSRRCRYCKQPFIKPIGLPPSAPCCSIECGAAYGQKVATKTRKYAEKEQRKKTRKEFEALKGIPELKKDADTAFARYIRLRDQSQLCITCECPLPNDGRPGGNFDCGHMRSKGSADHLRYCEDNAAGQCKRCNRRLGGRYSVFQVMQERRIGRERFDNVINNNTSVKWTKDGLRAIKAEYSRKARELKREQG